MKQRNETATQPELDDQPWLVSRGTHMTTKQSQANKEQENGITDLVLGFDKRGVATFEVDIPVSEQYATVYRKRLLSPEHELAIAILDEAIGDFQRHFAVRDTKGKKHFAETEAWFLDTDTDWTFSFENICEVLGFDPGYLRQGLLRWKQAQLPKQRLTESSRSIVDNRPSYPITGLGQNQSFIGP
jgi:hypothetical protein